MPTVTNPGGSIYALDDHANDAAVTTATATQIDNSNLAVWVVVLKDPPSIRNYVKDQKLIYNSRGTRNPNANNELVVTKVDGPAKYTCSGPWPMNI